MFVSSCAAERSPSFTFPVICKGTFSRFPEVGAENAVSGCVSSEAALPPVAHWPRKVSVQVSLHSAALIKPATLNNLRIDVEKF